MKKTWVKREHIYYKPFYKQKIKLIVVAIFAIGIIFISYQLFYFNQLPNSTTINYNANTAYVSKYSFSSSETKEKITIRGIFHKHRDKYKLQLDGMFWCLDGSKQIPYSKINDDYCDCVLDGSDETETNACAQGKFYCHSHSQEKEVYIPSSRINDGICDCCNGSDEWKSNKCKNKCL